MRDELLDFKSDQSLFLDEMFVNLKKFLKFPKSAKNLQLIFKKKQVPTIDVSVSKVMLFNWLNADLFYPAKNGNMETDEIF